MYYVYEDVTYIVRGAKKEKRRKKEDFNGKLSPRCCGAIDHVCADLNNKVYIHLTLLIDFSHKRLK
jgi:hypothetical protein